MTENELQFAQAKRDEPGDALGENRQVQDHLPIVSPQEEAKIAAQNIEKILSDSRSSILTINKDKIEQELVGIFAVRNSVQIADLAKTYRQGNLLAQIQSSPDISQATKLAISRLAKGSDKLTDRDRADIVEVALKEKNLGLFQTVLRSDKAENFRRSFMQNNGEAKIKAAFAGYFSLVKESGDLKDARDYASFGKVDLLRIIKDQTGYIYNNNEGIDLALKQMSPKERQNYFIGKKLEEGQSVSGLGQQAQIEARNFYRIMQKQLIEAASYTGSGLFGHYDKSKLARWESLIAEPESRFVSDIKNIGKYSKNLVDSFVNLSYKELKLAKENPQLRTTVDASLQSFGLNESQRQDLMRIYDEKVRIVEPGSSARSLASYARARDIGRKNLVAELASIDKIDGKNIAEIFSRMTVEDKRLLQTNESFRKQVIDTLETVTKNPIIKDLASYLISKVQRGKDPELDAISKFQIEASSSKPNKLAALHQLQALLENEKEFREIFNSAQNNNTLGYLRNAGINLFGESKFAPIYTTFQDNLAPGLSGIQRAGVANSRQISQIPLKEFLQEAPKSTALEITKLFDDIAKANMQDQDKRAIASDKTYRDKVLSFLSDAEKQLASDVASGHKFTEAHRLAILVDRAKPEELVEFLSGQSPTAIKQIKNQYKNLKGQDAETAVLAKVGEEFRSEAKKALRSDLSAVQWHDLALQDMSQARKSLGAWLNDRFSYTGSQADDSMHQFAKKLEAAQAINRRMSKAELAKSTGTFLDALNNHDLSKAETVGNAALVGSMLLTGGSTGIIGGIGLKAGLGLGARSWLTYSGAALSGGGSFVGFKALGSDEGRYTKTMATEDMIVGSAMGFIGGSTKVFDFVGSGTARVTGLNARIASPEATRNSMAILAARVPTEALSKEAHQAIAKEMPALVRNRLLHAGNELSVANIEARANALALKYTQLEPHRSIVSKAISESVELASSRLEKDFAKNLGLTRYAQMASLGFVSTSLPVLVNESLYHNKNMSESSYASLTSGLFGAGLPIVLRGIGQAASSIGRLSPEFLRKQTSQKDANKSNTGSHENDGGSEPGAVRAKDGESGRPSSKEGAESRGDGASQRGANNLFESQVAKYEGIKISEKIHLAENGAFAVEARDQGGAVVRRIEFLAKDAGNIHESMQVNKIVSGHGENQVELVRSESGGESGYIVNSKGKNVGFIQAEIVASPNDASYSISYKIKNDTASAAVAAVSIDPVAPGEVAGGNMRGPQIRYYADGSAKWEHGNTEPTNWIPKEGSEYQKVSRAGEYWRSPEGSRIWLDGEKRLWHEVSSQIFYNKDAVMAENREFVKVVAKRAEKLDKDMQWQNPDSKAGPNGERQWLQAKRGDYKVYIDEKGTFYCVEEKYFESHYVSLPGQEGYYAKRGVTRARLVDKDAEIETSHGKIQVRKGIDYEIIESDGKKRYVHAEQWNHLYDRVQTTESESFVMPPASGPAKDLGEGRIEIPWAKGEGKDKQVGKVLWDTKNGIVSIVNETDKTRKVFAESNVSANGYRVYWNNGYLEKTLPNGQQFVHHPSMYEGKFVSDDGAVLLQSGRKTLLVDADPSPRKFAVELDKLGDSSSSGNAELASRKRIIDEFKLPDEAKIGDKWTREGKQFELAIDGVIQINGANKTLLDSRLRVWQLKQEEAGKTIWQDNNGNSYVSGSSGRYWYWNDKQTDWVDTSGQKWYREAWMNPGTWLNENGDVFAEGSWKFEHRAKGDNRQYLLSAPPNIIALSARQTGQEKQDKDRQKEPINFEPKNYSEAERIQLRIDHKARLADANVELRKFSQEQINALYEDLAGVYGRFSFRKGVYEAELLQVNKSDYPNGIIFTTSEVPLVLKEPLRLSNRTLAEGTVLPNGVQLIPKELRYYKEAISGDKKQKIYFKSEEEADAAVKAGDKVLKEFKQASVKIPEEGVILSDGSKLTQADFGSDIKLSSEQVAGGQQAKSGMWIITRPSSDDLGNPRIDTYHIRPDQISAKFEQTKDQIGTNKYFPRVADTPVEMVPLPDRWFVEFKASYGDQVKNHSPAFLVKTDKGHYILTERDLRETYGAASSDMQAFIERLVERTNNIAGRESPRATSTSLELPGQWQEYLRQRAMRIVDIERPTVWRNPDAPSEVQLKDSSILKPGNFEKREGDIIVSGGAYFESGSYILETPYQKQDGKWGVRVSKIKNVDEVLKNWVKMPDQPDAYMRKEDYLKGNKNALVVSIRQVLPEKFVNKERVVTNGVLISTENSPIIIRGRLDPKTGQLDRQAPVRAVSSRGEEEGSTILNRKTVLPVGVEIWPKEGTSQEGVPHSLARGILAAKDGMLRLGRSLARKNGTDGESVENRGKYHRFSEGRIEISAPPEIALPTGKDVVGDAMAFPLGGRPYAMPKSNREANYAPIEGLEKQNYYQRQEPVKAKVLPYHASVYAKNAETPRRWSGQQDDVVIERQRTVSVPSADANKEGPTKKVVSYQEILDAQKFQNDFIPKEYLTDKRIKTVQSDTLGDIVVSIAGPTEKEMVMSVKLADGTQLERVGREHFIANKGTERQFDWIGDIIIQNDVANAKEQVLFATRFQHAQVQSNVELILADGRKVAVSTEGGLSLPGGIVGLGPKSIGDTALAPFEQTNLDKAVLKNLSKAIIQIEDGYLPKELGVSTLKYDVQTTEQGAYSIKYQLKLDQNTSEQVAKAIEQGNQGSKNNLVLVEADLKLDPAKIKSDPGQIITNASGQKFYAYASPRPATPSTVSYVYNEGGQLKVMLVWRNENEAYGNMPSLFGRFPKISGLEIEPPLLTAQRGMLEKAGIEVKLENIEFMGISDAGVDPRNRVIDLRYVVFGSPEEAARIRGTSLTKSLQSLEVSKLAGNIPEAMAFDHYYLLRASTIAALRRFYPTGMGIEPSLQPLYTPKDPKVPM